MDFNTVCQCMGEERTVRVASTFRTRQLGIAGHTAYLRRFWSPREIVADVILDGETARRAFLNLDEIETALDDATEPEQQTFAVGVDGIVYT